MVLNAAVSATVNVFLLAIVPFSVYYMYHRRKNGQRLPAVAKQAGLQVGDARYGIYGAVAAVGIVICLTVFPPPIEPLIREGSAQRSFLGLGFGMTSATMAVLYGVIQTGFAEELLFRGLIAGALSRLWTPVRANLAQAFVFLLPHFLILSFAPEAWWVLLVIFAAALFVGWLRIASGSILGPWVVHGAVNVTVALSIAVRSSP